MKLFVLALQTCLFLMLPNQLLAQQEKVVDIPTRPGIVLRMSVITPNKPKAAVVLFAGGNGGLQITPKGEFKWGANNFLVRTRNMFASNGLVSVATASSGLLETL
jgi:hypothetical protein